MEAMATMETSLFSRAQRKTDFAPESLGKRFQAHTEDTQSGFLQQTGQEKSAIGSIAEHRIV